MKARAVLADETELEADYSSAYVKIMDREVPVPVLLMDCPMPLLGAFTLQVSGLKSTCKGGDRAFKILCFDLGIVCSPVALAGEKRS